MNEVVWFLQQPNSVFVKVLLVWGEQAFDNVSNHKKNPLINPQKVDTRSKIVKIIVFQESDKNLQLTTFQMYGGEPVLLLDMSQVHFQTIMESLLKIRRTFICALNLPFWSHQCVPLSDQNIDQLVTNGGANSVSTLKKLSELKHVCFGCFKSTQGGWIGNLPCQHHVCDACQVCYHPDHKTEPEHIKAFYF